MAYLFHQMLCPSGQDNNLTGLVSLKYITIHTADNYSSDATAESYANYLFSGGKNEHKSWHYTVDADNVWQSFEDNQACRHVEDGVGNMDDANLCSIAVKICVNDKKRFHEACSNAAELTAGLLARYNLSLDCVVQHYYWSKKNCPKELRDPTCEWGISWESFLGLVDSAHTFLQGLINGDSGNVGDWARAAWNWAYARGIIDGTDPKGYITREQAVDLLYKFATRK
jgi:N-acetylmuramoyl-L-alanine amidase CwlA